ncbi:hypothetical protein BOTBODRAFT_28034 [Botryobasidium botryosum FD-172 SS1]|uniref:Uncharacterized protein n=1 Tax=Botryobasidium botryosum (strain FD-172 SS1) TaxID=930990 RepID=A0A067N6R2_BOTB1|nr:hypothetical protein BOTBODRAFT_28034 [Botryobasidium botryosum FD-172 SS1]
MFDMECLERSNQMYANAGSPPRCPCCRQEFDRVIRLYIPAQSEPPESLEPARPLSETQGRIAREIEESAAGLGIESSNTDLEAVIGRAESLMLNVDTTHGNTDAKGAIRNLEKALQSLRNRLRYAVRLDSLRDRLAEEKESRLRAVERCNETQRHFKQLQAERNQYLKNAEATMLELQRLHAMEKQWREREVVHQQELAAERQRLNTSANTRDQLEHALQEVKIVKTRFAKCKKKYLAAKSELDKLRKRTESRDCADDSADSLEFVS